VKNSDHFQALTSQSVRNHVRCARNHQLPRASDSARTAQIRQLSETLDRLEPRASDSIGGVGIVARDVRTEVSEVFD
jgi:hypothetical protein